MYMYQAEGCHFTDEKISPGRDDRAWSKATCGIFEP